MSEQPRRATPQLDSTDFESMTHEQLAAMLHSADSESAANLSVKLSKAASTIIGIGNDLMEHVKDLEWQGKGGDAFRDWGGHAAGATLSLGQYATVASRWMGDIADSIAHAKAAMPATSETTQAKADLADAHKTIEAARQPGARNDPDARKAAQTAQTDATNAQTRIDAARGEAIMQMRKLAQVYTFSTQHVNSMPPPTFAPPAGNTGDADWWRQDSTYVSPGTTYTGSSHSVSGTAGTHAGDSYTGGRHNSPQLTSAEPGATAPVRAGTHVPVPSAEPVSLDIDSVDTLPRTSQAPGITPPTVPALPPREVAPTGLPIGVPPAFAGGGRDLSATLPSRGPGMGRLPQQVAGLAKPTSGLPGAPRESGIVGGKPVSATGRPTNGIPRGNIIGGENTQGRTPLGRAVSSGTPASEGGRAGGGIGSGRRLASGTGGVAGRTGQQGHIGGRPFTSGGSGLVRPSAKAGDDSHSSQAGRAGSGSRAGSSRESRYQQDRRPDYLVEDEETWIKDGRRTLPPVVD
ncbi:WXG100 family type VII secretion target [Streptomyces sp. NPDC001091]